MNKTAFIFPGQGAQAAGMGMDFYNKFSSSKNVFDTASDKLGFDITGMMFDPERSKEMDITENTQPAILTASCAMLGPFMEISGIEPSFAAGLSLGEYTAHVCAGSLPFEDAVVLVRKRGRYMQQAVPIGAGTMAAIIGLDRAPVEEACAGARPFGIVETANLNCPGQIVISGAVAAVEKACELCREKGAKRAVMLPVSAPFHSSMLIEAEKNLEKELIGYEFGSTRCKVVANINAEVIQKKEDIKGYLIKQVTHSVLWWDCVNRLIGEGVDTFIEIGPGKTLTGFLRKIDPEVKGYNIATVDDMYDVVNKIKIGG